jgi:hypothetical protein
MGCLHDHKLFCLLWTSDLYIHWSPNTGDDESASHYQNNSDCKLHIPSELSILHHLFLCVCTWYISRYVKYIKLTQLHLYHTMFHCLFYFPYKVLISVSCSSFFFLGFKCSFSSIPFSFFTLFIWLSCS